MPATGCVPSNLNRVYNSRTINARPAPNWRGAYRRVRDKIASPIAKPFDRVWDLLVFDDLRRNEDQQTAHECAWMVQSKPAIREMFSPDITWREFLTSAVGRFGCAFLVCCGRGLRSELMMQSMEGAEWEVPFDAVPHSLDGQSLRFELVMDD